MSEEAKKSAFKLFAQAQQTYAEAEEKAKSEAGKPKVERFRIGEDGDYTIRVLPLAPVLDAEGNALPMDRKGYEYPLHQFFLSIDLPAKKGKKSKKISIPVMRATDKGINHSVDLIDTYLKIAKEIYADDKELLEAIDSSAFNGGLRYNYQHAMMVLDLTSEQTRAKGPMLWQCSHGQYKDLDAAKMRLWQELRADGEQETCPISWFTDAYPVKVIRKTDKKTEYTIEIGRKRVDVKEEEVEKLLDLPRIPDLINRFTLYSLEAELCFLQQYDAKHDMEVCKEPDFLEAVEKLKGELPADDTNHFDLASADKDDKSESAEITIDSLWDDYDNFAAQDLADNSDEGNELKEKIRQFVEDNDLDVRLSRSKSIKQLLEEVEDALEESSKQAAPAKEEKKEEKKEDEEEPVQTRRRPRPTVEEPEDDPEDEDDDDDEEEDPGNAPEPNHKEEQQEEQGESERHIHRRRRS